MFGIGGGNNPIKRFLVQSCCLHIALAIINFQGKDIQRILGVKPGKIVGEALQYLKDVKYEWEMAGKDMKPKDAELLILNNFGIGRRG